MGAAVSCTYALLNPPTPLEDLPSSPLPKPQDFNIPDEAWGARVAFGLLQPGEGLAPAFQREAAIANATRAAELQNQFLDGQREILHTGPDAFLSKTGRDAVLGADGVLARLDSLRRATLDQAANEAQRQMLREPLGQHGLLEHITVGDHVGRQTRAWRNATAASRLDLLRRQAELNYADPDTIEALHTASDSATQELSRTMPRDAGDTFLDPGNHPSIWRVAIDAALGKLDFPSAIVLYNRAADRLDQTDLQGLSPQIEAAANLRSVGPIWPSSACPRRRTSPNSTRHIKPPLHRTTPTGQIIPASAPPTSISSTSPSGGRSQT